MKPLLLAITLLLVGCGDSDPPAPTTPLQASRIVGSAEHPDPVLARVRELEAAGVVRDVVVQESFPVQIRLRAPAAVIADLEAIPRVAGLPDRQAP